MASGPIACRVHVEPAERFELVPLAERLPEAVARSPRLLVASLHTTAGLLEADVARRCGNDPAEVRRWLRPVHGLFPADADYSHDALHLRSELTPEQREVEPKNADAHLTFIGAGLQGCVTLDDPASAPPWLVELDGVSEHEHRRRQVIAVGFEREIVVADRVVDVPVSPTADALDLRDPGRGVWPVVAEMLGRHEIDHGRLDIALDPEESHAGLSVNEHETLLMQHDLAQVLRDPVHFALERGRHLAKDPGALFNKGLDYARHDAFKLIGRVEAMLGRGGSLALRVAERFLGPAAGRILRVRPSISFPACPELATGDLPLVQGRYQSPLLVQWRAPRSGRRMVHVKLVRFE